MLGHFFPPRRAARIVRLQPTAGLAAVALCGGLLTQAAVADSTTTWGGLTWGIGIATNFDVGGSRINGTNGVTVVNSGGNNIVRLTDTSSNVGISFVLESHYFFPGTATNPTALANDKTSKLNCTEWAWGPFIAIEVGDGTTAPTSTTSGSIAAFAMGLMVGLHRPTVDSKGQVVPNDKSSWNFGIGLRVDPSARVLGDGIVANQPLPAGEATSPVRTKTEPRAGVMLMSSFSF